MCFRKPLGFLLIIIFPSIECIPVLISKYQDSHYINNDAAYSLYFLATLMAVYVVIGTGCCKRKKLRISEWQGQAKKPRLSSLAEYGYKFDRAGRLCEIRNESNGFNFYHYESRQENQRRYEEIGKLVEEHVFSVLENNYEMARLTVPSDGSPDYSDSTFIFASRDYEKQNKLMVLIHGSGVVRAGQWSRSLIINNGVESGSQIPYIKEAMKKGYAVLVLNTNDNNRNGKLIRGSETPEKHARYVWENYIREAEADYIAIVAHSYGGKVTTSLINSFKREFQDKVFAVAFTDATIGSYPAEFRAHFNEIGMNWVTSCTPLGTKLSSSGLPFLCGSSIPHVSAGTELHEETSHKAIKEVFRFIQDRLDAVVSVGSERPQSRKRKAPEISHSQGPAKKLKPVPLSEYGYKFDSAGRLRDIHQKSQGFKFDYYKNKEADQKRYEEIGVLVDEYVYSELENKCKMVRLPLPIEGSPDWSDSTFIFANKDYKVKDKLMVLIHGSGVVRAGQWSRRLIINDSMESGSQIPYIKKAVKQGYAVLVLNTNDNSRSGRLIRNSETPEKHAHYVWKNYIREAKADYIAIVAHSYGGSVTTSLLNSFKEEFKQKVFAVAFTDAGIGRYPDDVRERFEEIGRNWVKSNERLGTPLSESGLPRVSAGTVVHEETSHKAIDEVFKFIKSRLEAEQKKAASSWACRFL